MSEMSRAGDFLRTRHRLRPTELAPWVIALACFFLFPSYQQFGAQTLIMVLFALSIDLILGYAGIISLGHAAFFGVGAYTAGMLAVAGWKEPITGLVLGIAVAALVGFLSGKVILRTRGLTLLMLTMSITILLTELANDLDYYTGGADGLRGIEISPLLGFMEWDIFGTTGYIYALVVLFLFFILMRLIVYSPFGQSLTGIRENVRRMHAIGADARAKLVVVYTISAGMAGAAGALLAQTTQFVATETLSFGRSGDVLIVIILGGFGRLYGALIGGPIFMLLQDQLAKASPVYWQFGLGLALVLTVLYAPRGVLGIIEAIARRLKGRGR